MVESLLAIGCLLARRLVEKDMRFVEVTLGGWDIHSDNFEGTPARSAILDQAMSTLLADLESRGLLDRTLVVLRTEFGRTPRINDDDGRDIGTTSKGPQVRARYWTRR